jgi:hypothetical protein
LLRARKVLPKVALADPKDSEERGATGSTLFVFMTNPLIYAFRQSVLFRWSTL